MSGRRRPTRQRRAELSQHFLRDASAARLVRATSITHTDLVVEIGPGRGALTKPLAKQAGAVLAVELDRYLANKLVASSSDNVEIVAADFLDFDLPTQAYSVVANIPFSKSTEIVRKLADAANPPLDAWLVVQKELANRLCGPPYAKESLWSLRLKPFWHLEIVSRLNKNEFDPPPAVDSVFLLLKHRGRVLVGTKERQAYFELLDTAFKQHGSLAQALRSHISKRQLKRLASDLNFSPTAHASDLSFEQWLGVFRFTQSAIPARE